MNPKVAARQARLLQMLESKEEIRIGRERDCPLPLPQLVRLTEAGTEKMASYFEKFGTAMRNGYTRAA